MLKSMIDQAADYRGAAPAVGILFLAGLTVVAAGSIGVVALDIGQPLSTTPQAALDAETGAYTITVTHLGGEQIDRENLAVTGGELVTTPDPFQTRDRLVIKPTASTTTLVHRETALDGGSVLLTIDAVPPAVVKADGALLLEGDDFETSDSNVNLTVTNVGDEAFEFKFRDEDAGLTIGPFPEPVAPGEQDGYSSGVGGTVEDVEVIERDTEPDLVVVRVAYD